MLDKDVLATARSDYHDVEKLLWCDMHVSAAIQREWSTSLGQRTAENREPPVRAVAMSPADSTAIIAARERLAHVIDLPRIQRVDPASNPATLLNAGASNFGRRAGRS